MSNRTSPSRKSALVFWPLWLGVVAAFTALAAWCDRRYELPGDRRLTFEVQELLRYDWADRAFTLANDIGERQNIALALAVAVGVLLLRRLWAEALITAGSGAFSYVYLAVREIVRRPDEQFLEMHNVTFEGLFVPTKFPGPDGFPSGHALGEAVVYGLIFAYAGRALRFWPLVVAVRAFCVFVIAAGGPARMYTGAHWGSDVVGAWLLALVYLLIAWRVDGLAFRVRSHAGSHQFTESRPYAGSE